MGLPETGKTTFLAALWYLINSDVKEKSFELVEFSGDDTYLNKLMSNWVGCKYVPRTTTDQVEGRDIRITLRPINSLEKIELFIPDFSGETYRVFWEDRRWSSEFEQLINSVDGILLFVNVKNIIDHVPLDKIQSIDDVFVEDENEDEIIQNNIDSVAWDINKIPTQVSIVDLLQFLQYHTNLEHPIKIGLCLSAWDIVLKMGKDTPNNWLKKNLPLVYQFLMANSDIFSSNILGVSAQGGEYVEEKNERKNLLEKDDPFERIIIQENDNTFHDIAYPIKWLMN